MMRRGGAFGGFVIAIAAMVISRAALHTIISIALATLVVLVVGEMLLLAYAADVETEHEIPRAMPDSSLREAAYNDRFEALQRTSTEPDTALFLLDEAKRRFTAVVDGGKAVEEKARQMLALVAGGSSAVALFAAPGKEGKVVALSAPIVAALLLTLVAFAVLLYVLRVKERNEPSIATFISEPMASNPKNRSVLALALAEDFEAETLAIYWDRRREPWAMFAAYLCVIAAAFLLALNAVLGAEAKGTPMPANMPTATQTAAARARVSKPNPVATPLSNPKTTPTSSPCPAHRHRVGRCDRRERIGAARRNRSGANQRSWDWENIPKTE